MAKFLGKGLRLKLAAPTGLRLMLEMMLGSGIGMLIADVLFQTNPLVLLALWCTVNIYFVCHRTPDGKGLDFKVW
ncbi:hypothetical protein [Massilia glaciei]|uniref:Uncharacterized protein n=1 Tax=Massilia glaciei TaxID=1524097 RepID=A0A2U2I5P7_9BURK|nr:hypothetical protein [Massilia glaciei]PWF55042.1 hypothetical protein C7C56_003950 [Massilia glaciei]